MAKKFIDADLAPVYLNAKACEQIKRIPAADVQEVRHGKWVECDYKKLEHGFIETFPNEGLCCSNCRTAFRKRDLWVKNYCPNCGARMDGEV